MGTTELKKQLCNKLLEDGKLRLYDVIYHSYTNNRLSGKRPIQTIQCQEGNMCPTLTTRTDCMGVVDMNYRIRKLIPIECFRLMGVKDEDFKKAKENQSDMSLYHIAGDAIVVDVLMAIFRQML